MRIEGYVQKKSRHSGKPNKRKYIILELDEGTISFSTSSIDNIKKTITFQVIKLVTIMNTYEMEGL